MMHKILHLPYAVKTDILTTKSTIDSIVKILALKQSYFRQNSNIHDKSRANLEHGFVQWQTDVQAMMIS